MNKKTILVDMDGVLENLSEEWTSLLNQKYGLSVLYEDIQDWDMRKAFPMLTDEQIFGIETSPELYHRLKPIPGAQKNLQKLIDDGHDVFILTSSAWQIVPVRIHDVLFHFFPYITWDKVIIASRKQMIRGDILIDDGIHNLIDGDYIKILFTAPYNSSYDAEFHGMFRVNSWDEIYNIIHSLC